MDPRHATSQEGAALDSGTPPNLETLFPPSAAAPLGVAGDPNTFPKQLGRYQLLKRLGAGGMGAVYLAHDTHLDRCIALKIPGFAPGDNPEILERFHREAKAAAVLQHPNLCPVYDVGQINGTHYLTMAYLEGQPLSALLQPGHPLSPRKAAAIVRQLSLALAYAHAHGVIHRDLKPSNIMLNEADEPVVMDFGLARRSNQGVQRLTKSGQILGTPSYMSPEQVEGDVESMGPSCDIYSSGVILYELLTGRLPFEGPLTKVLGQILAQQPIPPAVHRPDLDPELNEICLKAMAKKVQDRFTSMQTLAEALSAYLQSEPATSAAEPSTALLSVSRPAKGKGLWAGRRRIGLAVIATAVTGILGVVFYLNTNHGKVRIESDDITPAAKQLGHKSPTTEDSRKPPDVFQPVRNSIGMNLLYISPGSFQIGSPKTELGRRELDAETQNRVTLTRGFYMATTLVTQAQWLAVTGENPSSFRGNEDELPVDSVSWDDCQSFCKQLSVKEGRKYRLPTEAEWEYACRAGTTTPFWFGNTISTDQANYNGTNPYGISNKGIFRERTTSVKQFPANPWGLHDMHGNLGQWCEDRYGPYSPEANIDPNNQAGEDLRIIRGGSWGSDPAYCRAAFRNRGKPGTGANRMGCRVVLCVD